MARKKADVFMTCFCKSTSSGTGFDCNCKIKSLGRRGRTSRTRTLRGFDLVEIRKK